MSLAKRTAEHAGRAIVEHWAEYAPDLTEKGPKDFASAADRAADAILSAAIKAAFPGHRILSEQADDGPLDFAGPVWILDPLDGTANYVRGHTYFAVSIAYAVDGIVKAGCVHAPRLGETFLATRGEGATLNGRPIRMSGATSLARSVVSTGFPHDKSDLAGPLRRFSALLSTCQDIRRSAAPVLDIAYVGAGRLDGHAEQLFAWDVAAAGLIALEAGARRSHLAPVPADVPTDVCGDAVVFSAAGIHDELLDVLRRA
jgi:myo-inositol-1(or 4)-monophosphatase